MSDEVYEAVFPLGESAPGRRLHIYREPGEIAILADETVLPEKVLDLKVHRVISSTRLFLTRADVRWARDRFNELLEIMDAEALCE